MALGIGCRLAFQDYKTGAPRAVLVVVTVLTLIVALVHSPEARADASQGATAEYETRYVSDSRVTYRDPMLGNFRLDWCLRWGEACGKPAADEFCRRVGYESAFAFEQAPDIGQWSPTMVIASGQVCDHFTCDGFSSITCTRGGAAVRAPTGQEEWRLTRREYPVLAEAVLNITEGRNAGSFISLRRTPNRNEVLYINVAKAWGETQCEWISGFVWDESALPQTIVTGSQEIMIELRARHDRRHGNGCGAGSISVVHGNRAEPLRDRAANIRIIQNGLADPDPGGVSPPISTEKFMVQARPDLPGNNMFTVAVVISDGAVTSEVVALYVYEKVRRY